MREDSKISISPLDYEAIAQCQLRLDNLAKPLGSFRDWNILLPK